jgi:RimJ/RimL family protein N-acetyltransferase
MEKLGLHRDPQGDFDMPKLAVGHPFRRTVIYQLRKDEWINQNF